jgi:hypothetical protein
LDVEHALQEWKHMKIATFIHYYDFYIGEHDKEYQIVTFGCSLAIPLGMFVVYTTVLAVI